MIHVDETRVSIKGKTAYVWVLDKSSRGAISVLRYREGEIIQKLLQTSMGFLFRTSIRLTTPLIALSRNALSI